MCEHLPLTFDHVLDESTHGVLDQRILTATYEAHGAAIYMVLVNALGCNACAQRLLDRSLMASCAKKHSLPGFQPCFSDALHLACAQCTHAQRPKVRQLMRTWLMRTVAVVGEEEVLR